MFASSAQNMPASKVSVLPKYGSGPWGLTLFTEDPEFFLRAR